MTRQLSSFPDPVGALTSQPCAQTMDTPGGSSCQFSLGGSGLCRGPGLLWVWCLDAILPGWSTQWTIVGQVSGTKLFLCPKGQGEYPSPGEGKVSVMGPESGRVKQG